MEVTPTLCASSAPWPRLSCLTAQGSSTHFNVHPQQLRSPEKRSGLRLLQGTNLSDFNQQVQELQGDQASVRAGGREAERPVRLLRGGLRLRQGLLRSVRSSNEPLILMSILIYNSKLRDWNGPKQTCDGLRGSPWSSGEHARSATKESIVQILPIVQFFVKSRKREFSQMRSRKCKRGLKTWKGNRGKEADLTRTKTKWKRIHDNSIVLYHC